MRIAVTGIGIVSAAGLNVAENLATLRAGRSGIAPRPVRLATRHCLPVGEVPLSNEELAARLGIGELQSRTTLLGMMAAEEALKFGLIDHILSSRHDVAALAGKQA